VSAVRPVIHCITNGVTAGRVADALAAAGAAPIMAAAEGEVAAIAARADAVVLNCGTPDAERFRVLCVAGAAARASGIAVVLDPVGCGASEWRTLAIRELATAMRPGVIRGGAAEIAVLADLPTDARLRGVHSIGGDAVVLARDAARSLGSVVVIGDTVSDGQRLSTLPSGPALLDRVVGAGDVLDALIALACVGEADRFCAAEAAQLRFTTAANAAAECGPGSFWPAFIDALARS